MFTERQNNVCIAVLNKDLSYFVFLNIFRAWEVSLSFYNTDNSFNTLWLQSSEEILIR